MKHPSSSGRRISAFARNLAAAGLAVAAVATGPGLGAETPATTAPATTSVPAVNWVLPLFTDKEGWRTMTLRGSDVRQGKDHLAVTDLSITVFSGDAAAKVDTILLSPDAQYYPKQNRAAGAKQVRVIRDDMEVTGHGWNYDHAAKKVSLDNNVRVVFRAQLNDILK